MRMTSQTRSSGAMAYEWYAGDPDSVRWSASLTAIGAATGPPMTRSGEHASAALFGPNIRCDRVPAKLPQLWINPWAAVPFNQDDGFTTTTVRDDDGEIIRNEGTLRAPAVFSLDPAWPFFSEM